MRRPPLDPETRALLAALTPRPAAKRTTSRRAVLAGFGAAALAAVGGCGTEGTQQTEQSCTSTDTSATDKKLAFSNWPQYLDVDDADDNRHPTLDAFEKQTGIRVTYHEEINDNDQFFGKIQNQLAHCRPTGRDIIVLTSWLAGRLISLGWVQELDPAKIPNVRANLLPSLRSRATDPGGRHAVPWQGGLTGLAYNASVTKEVRTVDELLTRPDLKGKVTMLTELRDTMGLMLQSLGHDPAEFTEAQFDAALDKLRTAVDSGQIRRFTGNDYAPELQRGDIAACVGWSGDIIQLSAQDDRISFVAPDSGIMLFTDDMMVPNQAAHRSNAEALMNYYYEPETAAKLAAYVNYICPVQGAQDAMTKVDPDLADNPLIFPTPDLLGKAKEFMPLTEAQSRTYNEKFQTVIGT
ncbi:polyamine ABC transporter substrate-binding protein [Mangrovihabitans endophyticus]|uniref:ABC transporter substrate-binding protein n=1 Tax=Mangrovihabitans endophyticus TaxID=1751298 RepID=A0A8J3FNC0_9ACTN|nr:spermidine/putrescine ABC transporter substrate-binding protein [Mangrovihabitans endophyticus]GGK85963.1 ABC transporter substrate-binding protein [Mangrovihabitans endophyticus]